MKNRFCLFILVALCFVTVLTSAASAKDYTVSDTDLTISIDDSYWYVFTRDNIEGNPELLAELDQKVRAMKDRLPDADEEFELDDEDDDFDIRTMSEDDEL